MFPSVQERGVGKVALVLLKVCLGVNYFIRRWHTVAASNRARQLQFRRALDGKKSSTKDSKKRATYPLTNHVRLCVPCQAVCYNKLTN